MLQLAALKGVAQGYIVTAPTMLVMSADQNPGLRTNGTYAESSGLGARASRAGWSVSLASVKGAMTAFS